MSMEGKCCSATVYRSGVFCGYQCLNKPKVERDGKLYCSVHDPVRIAEKRNAKEEKWKRQWDIKTAHWRAKELKSIVVETAEKLFDTKSPLEYDKLIQQLRKDVQALKDARKVLQECQDAAR